MFRETFSFDDILLVPRYSDLESRSECDITMENYNLPIIMSPMDTVTTPEMIKLFVDSNIMASVHRYFKTPEEQLNHVKQLGDEYVGKVFFAVGTVKKYKDWIDYLYINGVHNFLIDLAHGDSKLAVDTVEYLNNIRINPRIGGNEYVCKIMAGNVVTKSGFGRLEEAGADYIRCGIGNGSICSTRSQTSFGLSQGTAIQDCASRKNKAMLIADGGIKTNGDISKAIALGADFVMLGKMLASTDLAGGECYDKNKELLPLSKMNRKIYNTGTVIDTKIIYKSYHGMASKKARDGVLSYASIEGISGLIPYTGSTSDFLNDLELNLKASMSYCGVKTWQEFQSKAKIVFISNSSIIESGNENIIK